jgi:hypothetical protein
VSSVFGSGGRMTFSTSNAIEVLQRTPNVLRALLAGLSDGWTLNNYGEATFSPFDVVGHLIHADRTNWMTRLRVILEHGEPTPFLPFDRYAMYEASRGKSMDELLDTFASVRAENLGGLRAVNVTTAHLGLRGTHPELGGVTLGQLLAAWVVHDLGHLHQIVKAMAFQYRDAVGPWGEYLSILPKRTS